MMISKLIGQKLGGLDLHQFAAVNRMPEVSRRRTRTFHFSAALTY